MSKIILIGGSSEIGNALANKIINCSSKYAEILKISTTINDNETVKWNPMSISEIKEAFGKVTITQNDVVIIAIGTLEESWNQDKNLVMVDALERNIRVNSTVPMVALAHFANELKKVQGGQIILLSSTAAFPVLDNNFIYGNAKRSLDNFARHLQKKYSSFNVKINIVRSGFVQTKLNAGRKATPFSIDLETLSNQVSNQLDKKVIWTPPVFRFICLSLTIVPPLRLVANQLISRSRDK